MQFRTNIFPIQFCIIHKTALFYDNDYREVTVMCFFRWRAAEDSHSPHVGEGPGDHRV